MWEQGLTLGRYVIQRLLGQGGMADVYLGVHEVLGTQVAIKVLHGAPSASLRARLLREGRVQAGLQHPNVVRVLDVLEVDGFDALVLDFVDGPTLHEVLADGPLPLARVEALLVELVAGLEAAHAAGVVHRDLKPANVLLASGTTPRITDFGLATVLDSDERRLTRAGVGLGTPAYMAPEQVDDAHSVDRRADVFALGVLTYEMLVGAPPADGPALSVMHRMATGGWPPASASVAGLPARVDDALAWALAPAVVDRCPSAAEFLARLLGGTPAVRTTPKPPAAVSRPSLARALVGRDEVLDELSARVDRRGGLLVVTGPPGVGKTRLAAEVAARWVDARGEPARRWVDLSPFATLEAVEQQVALALDPDATDGGSVATLLSRRGAFLLVLDNLEHLPRELGPWLDALVTAAPSLRLLTTSREVPLGAQVEVTELPPLATGGPDPRATPAWRLFVTAAPKGAADGVSAEVAGQLLEALDGLPLCLELAAARLEVLDPEELLVRLASPTRVLRLPGAEGRHDALTHTLSWSWSLLSSDERRALSWLSLFRGSFSLLDAEALVERSGVEGALDAIHGLVRRSLVRRTGRRFALLRSIRDFAAVQLGADVRVAWVAFAQVLVPTADHLRSGPHNRARLVALAALAPELEAIVDWSMEQPALEEASLTCLGCLVALYHDLGPTRAVHRLSSLGLARAPEGHAERFRWLVSRALAERRQGAFAAARADLDAALALASDDHERANALVHLGDLAIDLGSSDEARSRYERCLELVGRAGRAHVLVSASISLAGLAASLEEARRWLDAARAAVPSDDTMSRVRWLKAAGWVALRYEQLQEAAGYYRELQGVAAELGDRRSELHAIAQLGMVSEATGDLPGAAAAYAVVIDWYRAEGDGPYAGFYRGAWGRVLARLGRWGEAEVALREAADTAHSEFASNFAQWAQLLAARRSPVPPPADGDWSWLHRALFARHQGDRAAVRRHLEERVVAEDIVDHSLAEVFVAELSAEVSAWRVAVDGSAFETPDGVRVDLSRHPANARILACLVAGTGLDAKALADAGWPGERILPAAAANRVRVALSHLRKAGLDPLIERAEGGWRLRPDIPVTSLRS